MNEIICRNIYSATKDTIPWNQQWHLVHQKDYKHKIKNCFPSGNKPPISLEQLLPVLNQLLNNFSSKTTSPIYSPLTTSPFLLNLPLTQGFLRRGPAWAVLSHCHLQTNSQWGYHSPTSLDKGKEATICTMN